MTPTKIDGIKKVFHYFDARSNAKWPLVVVIIILLLFNFKSWFLCPPFIFFDQNLQLQ